ncbi:MAG TPA: oligopeptide transporter, OPT family, partial [Planctomycetota bacterium]|nr:oligopeptide transporter, OPT family [Planctomycetota bacterium]
MGNPSGRTEPAAPEFKPFVPAGDSQHELTWRAVLIGSFLGLIFAASSVYLGLKVGLTVSASIPIAVLSITLFRWMTKAFALRKGTILENNIVQTTGSAGESIAAGVAFTLPSLLLMGFDMELSRILLVSLLGGLIGVLMMIPLRQGLIVKEHGRLTYPEGTACADVLIVGEQGGTSAKTVFLGFFVGLAYATANLILKLWADVSSFTVDFWGKLRGGSLGFEVSPPMLGVGYIIGPRTAANMMAGGSLAFLILVPLIHLFGDSMAEVMYPADKLIRDMAPGDVRNFFILYIGAGAVATGGFIALARAIPTILAAFAGGLRSMQAGGGAAAAAARRTERDLPMSVVIGGSLAIAVAIFAAPILEINALSAVLIVLFGFFFVTVSSRITGEIGSSSNPISGMTVATLLITCGLFIAMGWTGVGFKAMALTTAALVCVAASNGGTISQDLKTGFLVGATPRAQQLSILVGVVTSAILIGFTLELLNAGSTTYRPVVLPAGAMPAAEAPAPDGSAGHGLVSASAERIAGPDGVEYGVVYVREDVGAVLRGKYLVDAGGQPAFLVDPGVCGGYAQSLEPVVGGARVDVPPDAPTELGIDRRPYRSVTLAEPQDGLAAGRYLAAADGSVAYSVQVKPKYDAPKAQLFRLIIDGTLGGKLPIALVLVGAFLAIMMELVGVSSLPFAVGLYLPISTSAAIFVGGCVRWLVDRRRRELAAAEAEFSPGVLMASGLIAGGAITGVVQSIIAVQEAEGAFDLSGSMGKLAQNHGWWPLTPFLAMAVLLYVVGS